MTGSSIRYLIKEGGRSLVANRMMSLASIMVQMVCFLLIGASLLFSANIDGFLKSVERRNQIAVYVDPELDDQGIARVRNQLGSIETVEYVGDYVTPQEGLESLVRDMEGGNIIFTDLISDNPLPGLFRVSISDLSQQKQVMDKLKRVQGVINVRGSTDLADTLASIRNMVTFMGLAVVTILAIVSLVITANTIKLTILNRKREIGIMRLVGATNGFIRLPFVIEGIYIGLIAAGLAFGLIWWAYSYLTAMSAEWTNGFVKDIFSYLIPFEEIGWKIFVCFAAGGIFVSGIGSSFFIGRHLKV
ncbi:MAG: permease-like cell division protein FtsX [Oscillospiraceae bacterium]|jgi:cell division transport system permease protein|nr:permease-like cell division protein FtsX [Oscillospiraceae bacterium]